MLISFYTDDWRYPEYAAALKAQCDALAVPSHIERLPTTGSYLRNTCLKPRFILDCLNRFQQPVLWVDVDADLRDVPRMDWRPADMAARPMPPERSRRWHVGTLWFDYNPRVLAFVQAWVDATGALSDESSLDKVWRDNRCAIICTELPPEYFGLPGREVADTIISHRISNGDSKRQEMAMAARLRAEGVT